MGALKEFLHIRDTEPEYIRVKEEGRAGLPCLVVDGRVYVNDVMDFLNTL